jgi:hypothetical protein
MYDIFWRNKKMKANMSIYQINQFLTNTVVPQEAFFYFCKLKEKDKKIINSVISTFNLTQQESNLISGYAIIRVQPSYGELLKNKDLSTWLKLAAFIYLGACLILNIKIIFEEPTIEGSGSIWIDKKFTDCLYTVGLLAFLYYISRKESREMDCVMVKIMLSERVSDEYLKITS